MLIDRLSRVMDPQVSMKSGLEGRNNDALVAELEEDGVLCLNEVRPRRPEQYAFLRRPAVGVCCLNEVRPRRPEQCAMRELAPLGERVSMKSGLEGRNNPPGWCGRTWIRCAAGLNEVRPRRPEQ